MKPNYLGATPRVTNSVAGGILLVTDLLFALAIGVLLARAPADALWLIPILAIVCLGCAVVAWRLLMGHRRRADGGLFSPFFLRLASLIFVFGAVVSAGFHPAGILETLGAIGAAGACFGLARHRERHVGREQSGSAPIDPV